MENEWIDIKKTKNIDEVRNTKECKDWVKTVKARDNEKCVLCAADQHLEAHHVFSLRIAFLFALTRIMELRFVTGVIRSIMRFIIWRIPVLIPY